MNYDLISKFSSKSKDGRRKVEMVIVKMQGATCVISENEYTNLCVREKKGKEIV